MTMLFADGFELGTTLAEAATLSGNAVSLGTFVNATSSVGVGAATGRQGRSLQMTVYPNNTTSANRPLVGTQPLTNLLMGSGAVGYKFAMGFRAKLNATKPAFNTATGLSNVPSTGGYLAVGTTAALTTLPQAMTLTFGTGGNVIATLQTPSDYDWHYYSFYAVKTAANVWSLSFWIDKTLVYSGTNISAAMVDGSIFYYVTAIGGAVASQCNMFSEFDDMYIADTTPIGDVIIYRPPAANDVQAQWTRFGAAASNAAAVDKISTASTPGVTSNVSGAADLYGIADPSATVPRRRIVATKTTVYGTGDGTVNTTATAKSGSTNVSGTPTSLSVFGGVADTGWSPALANTPLANFQFGVTRS